MQGRPSQGEGLQQKKKGEKEKREKEQQEAAERERNKKEEEATATQSVPKGKAKGQKKGEATFPCKLLVHNKTCNRGDQCSYSHDAALVRRFQQAECPHGKGCAFDGVGSGCVYGKHNLPAPSAQDTVRDEEDEIVQVDANDGDAWYLDTCATAGVFKEPTLAPNTLPDSHVFFKTSNGVNSGPTWEKVQTPIGPQEATLLTRAASNVLPGYALPEGGVGITWFEENCPRPPGMEGIPDGCYVHGRTESGEVTSVQLDTSSKKPKFPSSLPFESCQYAEKAMPSVRGEQGDEAPVKEASDTVRVPPLTLGCFGCGGKDHLYAGCLTGRFVETARCESGVIPFDELPGKAKQELLKATHKRYKTAQPIAVWTSCDAALDAPLFEDVRVLDVTLDDRGAASWVKEAVSTVPPDPGRKARLYLDEVADIMPRRNTRTRPWTRRTRARRSVSRSRWRRRGCS